MRKVNPDAVKSDFQKALYKVKDLHEIIQQRFDDERNHLTALAEQSLMMMGVLWEGFIADLIAAYVNKDSSTLAATLTTRISESINSKFGEEARRHTKIHFPNHLKKAQVYSLIDPNDRNLTFKDATTMVNSVTKYLAQPHAEKFSKLTTADKHFIDMLKSMRNFIAHRSQSARETMNACLSKNQLRSVYRRDGNNVNSAGAYLLAQKGRPPLSRIEHAMCDLDRISNSL